MAEVSAFVRDLYASGKFARWAEFASVANVHPVSLSNWQNGEVMPDGYNLLKLIRAAAKRAEFAPAELALGTAQAEAVDDAEGLVARRLEELAAGVKEALILLRATQQPARGGRRKPTTGQS